MGLIKVRSNSGGNENFAPGGHYKTAIKNCGGSDSYATGGDKLYAVALGLTKIHSAKTSTLTNSGTYRIEVRFEEEDGAEYILLRFVVIATGNQVANAVDLSAERFRIEAIGTQ